MHLFFWCRSFSVINFHLVNKAPPVTNQRRELCVSRPWCCSLSLALPAVFVWGLLRCSVNINNLIIIFDKAKFTFRINFKADITLKSCKWWTADLEKLEAARPPPGDRGADGRPPEKLTPPTTTPRLARAMLASSVQPVSTSLLSSGPEPPQALQPVTRGQAPTTGRPAATAQVTRGPGNRPAYAHAQKPAPPTHVPRSQPRLCACAEASPAPTEGPVRPIPTWSMFSVALLHLPR